MKTIKTCLSPTARFISILSLMLYSCHDNDLQPNQQHAYFPLTENTTVEYAREFLSVTDQTTLWHTDTLALVVSGDTVVGGLPYKKIVDQFGSVNKIVRQEGTKYYGRNHEFYGGFSNEYLFLDSSLPLNSTWTHVKDEEQTKTEYIVTAVRATEIVNGVEYNDVLKLQVNYYNNNADGVTWQLLYTATHYYANGVGEIYAYYPSPVSRVFGDLRISVLP